MKPRAEYLATNSLSRNKPWEAENISKATWYRRRTKAETSRAGIKLTAETLPVSKQEVSSKWVGVCSPTQKPASPDWSNHPMSALRYWSSPVQVKRAACSRPHRPTTPRPR